MKKLIVIIVTVSILAVSVYSSTSLYTAYALQQSGQDGPISSNDQSTPSKNAPQQSGQGKYRCDNKYDGGPVTCCTRVKVDGQILSDKIFVLPVELLHRQVIVAQESYDGPRTILIDQKWATFYSFFLITFRF